MELMIRETLAEHGRLAVEARTVKSSANLYRNGLTSHASVNVMLALEDAFGVEFPDRLLKKTTFESIDAIAEALAELGCSTSR